MLSLEGHLLIAAPQMSDARFHRSVILMLHHDEHGAMGVILNRPIPRQAEAIATLLGDSLEATEGAFHVGGPVAGPLIVLQGLPDPLTDTSREDASPGRVFVVEQQDQLNSLMADADSSLRFYVGHAGWSEGQLESEIAQGAWLTAPASVDFVFGENDDMWVAAMRDFGRDFYRSVLGVHDFPDNPSDN